MKKKCIILFILLFYEMLLQLLWMVALVSCCHPPSVNCETCTGTRSLDVCAHHLRKCCFHSFISFFIRSNKATSTLQRSWITDLIKIVQAVVWCCAAVWTRKYKWKSCSFVICFIELLRFFSTVSLANEIISATFAPVSYTLYSYQPCAPCILFYKLCTRETRNQFAF